MTAENLFAGSNGAQNDFKPPLNPEQRPHAWLAARLASLGRALCDSAAAAEAAAAASFSSELRGRLEALSKDQEGPSPLPFPIRLAAPLRGGGPALGGAPGAAGAGASAGGAAGGIGGLFEEFFDMYDGSLVQPSKGRRAPAGARLMDEEERELYRGLYEQQRRLALRRLGKYLAGLSRAEGHHARALGRLAARAGGDGRARAESEADRRLLREVLAWDTYLAESACGGYVLAARALRHAFRERWAARHGAAAPAGAAGPEPGPGPASDPEAPWRLARQLEPGVGCVVPHKARGAADEFESALSRALRAADRRLNGAMQQYAAGREAALLWYRGLPGAAAAAAVPAAAAAAAAVPAAAAAAAAEEREWPGRQQQAAPRAEREASKAPRRLSFLSFWSATQLQQRDQRQRGQQQQEERGQQLPPHAARPPPSVQQLGHAGAVRAAAAASRGIALQAEDAVHASKQGAAAAAARGLAPPESCFRPAAYDRWLKFVV